MNCLKFTLLINAHRKFCKLEHFTFGRNDPVVFVAAGARYRNGESGHRASTLRHARGPGERLAVRSLQRNPAHVAEQSASLTKLGTKVRFVNLERNCVVILWEYVMFEQNDEV